MKAIASEKFLAFVALLFLSLVSWICVEEAPYGRYAAVAVIVIAAVKVRLVFIEFMGLTNKTQPWRTIFEIWTAVVATTILVGYWVSLT